MGINQSAEYGDVLTKGFVHGALTVNSVTPVEAKVGASPYDKRETLVIVNETNKTIYWGDASVTAANGIPIRRNQEVIMQVGKKVRVYLIADGTPVNGEVRIAELA